MGCGHRRREEMEEVVEVADGGREAKNFVEYWY